MPFFLGQPNIEKLKEKHNLQGLIKALNYQKDSNIRKAAANALGEIGNSDTVAPLFFVSIKDDQRDVRETALKAIVLLGSQSVEFLGTIINAPNIPPQARQIAVEMLGRIRNSQAVLPLLNIYIKFKESAFLNAEDKKYSERLRIAVMEALIQIGDPIVSDLFILALNDDNYQVRKLALEALSKIGDPRNVEMLVDSLKENTNSEARKAALRALGKISDSQKIDPFANVLTDQLTSVLMDGDKEVRKLAVEVLKLTNSEQRSKLLVTTLKDKDQDVSKAVREALSQIGGELEIKLLIELLFETIHLMDWNSIRYSIAWVLGEIGAKKGIELLVPILKDDNSVVREVAVKALGFLYNEQKMQKFEFLVNALKDENSGVRKAAVEEIRSNPQGYDFLVNALKDEDSEVRKAAVTALGNNPQGYDFLVNALKDEDSEVRKAAVRTLGFRRDQDGLKPIAATLIDANVDVRNAAIQVMNEMVKEGSKGDLKQIAKEALPHLLEAFEKHVDLHIPILNALIALGLESEINGSIISVAIDACLKTLFGGAWESKIRNTEEYLSAFIPVSALNKQIITWSIQVSGYEHKYSGAHHDAGFVSLHQSDGALEALCRKQTSMTSNILHLVTSKKDVYVTMSTGCNPDWEERVSFEKQRNLAREELIRRGNPPYVLEAYLISKS